MRSVLMVREMKSSIGSSPGSWLEVVPNAENVKYLTRSACTSS
jgi:hypothetical protein